MDHEKKMNELINYFFPFFYFFFVLDLILRRVATLSGHGWELFLFIPSLVRNKILLRAWSLVSFTHKGQCVHFKGFFSTQRLQVL